MVQRELDEMVRGLACEQEIVGEVLRFRLLPGLPEGCTFIYHLRRGRQTVLAYPRTVAPAVRFPLPGDGTYRVCVYLYCGGASASWLSEEIPFRCGRIAKAEEDYLKDGDPRFRDRWPPSELEFLLAIGDGAYYVFQLYADDLIALMEGNDGGRDISIPFSWKFDGAQDRGMAFKMHSFRKQGCLLTHYWKTGNTSCRDLFLQYVLDWIRAHPNVDLRDPWAWHDDATARRVYFFTVALLLFRKLLSEGQIRAIEDSLRMQARLLCRESFYKRDHNHGMYQDRALALYGLTYSEDPEYHLTMAMERSRMYFRGAFTKDGVHKEHSPAYHMDMASSIAWFALVYRDASPAYAEELTSLLGKMARYITWITMPDGYLPAIGDSPKRRRLVHLWENDPSYVWTALKGETGKPLEETFQIFPEAGYGVIRKDWNMDGEGTWMMLLAATHSMAHKHNDDLSVLLYHNGELITEAGNRNYNYADPLTEYVYTSYAHNVLFVDGEGWGMKPNHLPLLEPEAFHTRVTRWADDGVTASVTGKQTRFHGVTQERTLRYDRAREVVTVEDDFQLDAPHTLRLIFHTAPGVEVRETDTGWLLLRGGVPTAEAVPAGSGPVTRKTYAGDGERPWRTWIFQTYLGTLDPQRGGLLAVDMPCAAGSAHLRLTVRLL